MKGLKVVSRFGLRLALLALFVLPILAGITNPAAAASGGAVYAESNAAGGNAVLAYSRSVDGSLTFQAAYPTGGLGTGSGLGSQGTVALSSDRRWLFAVNAGSNQISVFKVKEDGLTLASVTDSSGMRPISLTVNGGLLYVLNAGGSGNITGFRVRPNGNLSPLAGSTRPLSNLFSGPAPAAAEISFSPDGETLVVTEKDTNLIDTYRVDHGIAKNPVTHPSSGATPFGFAFNGRGVLVVSEAFGGMPGLSAVSSYMVRDERLKAVSPSIATTQTAACWVAVSKDGRYAYATNAGSGTISSYQIAKNGTLTLLAASAANTGAGSSPVDMAFSQDGNFLYALTAAAHTIAAYQWMPDGSLLPVETVNVMPGAAGLAAR